MPQQPAWAIEKRRNPFDSIGADAPGGEFERKSNSVEFAADLANNRRVGVIQLEATVGGGALNKQLYRRIGERAGSRQRFIIRREGQWIQYMDLWSFPEDALRQWSDRLDQMLTAIEHQQQPPVTQESG